MSAETGPSELPGWRHVYSGKVRDLYVPSEEFARAHEAGASPLEYASVALVVASDRVSAFDHVLAPGIPGKGALLTGLSEWWFDQLSDIPNHFAQALDDRHTLHGVLPEIRERAMLVRPLNMFPIECVVRGYLTGSGWAEYQEHGTVCGIAVPAGLQNGDRLPAPLYTPAFKAPMGQHDENISFERSVELVGEIAAEQLRALSLGVFERASAIAAERGLILADTKFEFGADRETGIICLADEVLTSDSSRYWDAERYAAGGADRLDSFDKQIVRNWLAANWNQHANTPPPSLPAEIVEQTADRYRELVQRLTGE